MHGTAQAQNLKNKQFSEKTVLNTENKSPQQTTDVTMHAKPKFTMHDEKQENRTEKILTFCKEPKTREEIQNYIAIQHREYFRKKILKPLIENGLLLLTIKDKPNSPKQKYYSVNPKKEDQDERS